MRGISRFGDNTLATKNYPIGTKIRFINHRFDTNKTGLIVGYWGNGTKPAVFLPTAEKHTKDNRYPILFNGTKFTWKCGWDEIEPVGEQQLEFSFMYE